MRISTGEEAPLSEFNRRHSVNLLAEGVMVTIEGEAKWNTEVVYSAPTFALSPDGRYLLWRVRAGTGTVPEQSLLQKICRSPWQKRIGDGVWQAASLDGKEHIEWPFYGERLYVIWLPDSQEWLGVVNHYDPKSAYHASPRLYLQKRTEPSHKRVIDVSGLNDGLIVGITNYKALLVHHPEFSPSVTPAEREIFSEVSLQAKKAVARRFEIPLPIPGSVRNVLLSPDGKHLAWLIESRHSLYSLWMTDLEGGDAQGIGWTEGRGEDDEDSPSRKRGLFPLNLRWSPDGRYISFTFGRLVFAVPLIGDESKA